MTSSKGESSGAPAPRLSIIIVNYNGYRYIDKCLSSIRRYCDCPHEVIFVDNASVDDSVALVREKYPWVRVVESGSNLGFSAGNNLGASVARGDLLMLVNTDTELKTPISPMIERMDSEPRLGVLGCRLQFEDGSLQYSTGYDHNPVRIVLAWLGLGRKSWAPRSLTLINRRAPFYESQQTGIHWVWGAALLTRRRIWESLGGLDEAYFMYVEDVDFCKRVREEQAEVGYTPKVRMMHHSTAEGGSWAGERVLLWTIDSYIIFTRKFHGLAGLIFLRVALGLVMGLRAAYFAARSVLPTSDRFAGAASAYLSAAARLLWPVKRADADSRP